MSISRPFILRPIATSLLMVGLLLVGIVAYQQLPISGFAAGGLPHHPDRDVLSGRQSRRDGIIDHRSAGTPVRRAARPEPDDFEQLVRCFGHHPAVRSGRKYRRGRAGSAGRDQLRRKLIFPTDLPTPPIYSKVNPADAPILTLAMTSDSMPLPQVEDLADTTFAQKISQLPGVGLVSISGGQKPAVRIMANPDGAGFVWHEPGAVAHGNRPGQR